VTGSQRTVFAPVHPAYLRAAKALEKLDAENEDQRVGIRIVARALEEPLRQIASNSGDHAEIVVNRVITATTRWQASMATWFKRGFSTPARWRDSHSRTPPRSRDCC
jgi:hypothetical protein